MTPPKPLPPLRGLSVYLRPLEPEDVELVAAWFDDARILALMGELPQSRAARRRRLEAAAEETPDHQWSFVVCRLADDDTIGRADIFAVDLQQGSAAFGITIGDPALWGRGYGTDAVNVIADFAFGQLRLERLWLATDAANGRARAAYAKAGFREEGILRHAYYQDGQFVDEVRMAMLREEWLAAARPRSWELVAESLEADLD